MAGKYDAAETSREKHLVCPMWQVIMLEDKSLLYDNSTTQNV